MPKRWPDLPAFSPPPPTEGGGLSITSLRAWRLREPASGRRYTVVRVQSRSGLSGYGEGAAVPPAEVAEARAAVAGRRATDSEAVRHLLDHRPAMEAAVNNALLDLLGKSTGVPVYQYLGGPTRYKARVLARLAGRDEEALGEQLHRAAERGFRAFSFPIPGRDSMWRMQAYVDVIRRRFERLRAAAGPDTDFVLDAAATLTPGDAGFVATALERDHLLWLDEPTGVLTNDALAKITGESVMPVGLGRGIHNVSTFQNLLRWGCVDILRPSLGLNSIPKIRRMAAVAETHYVAVGPFHDGGPIGTVAAMHLAASLPNFFIQEVPLPPAEQDRAMRAALTGGDHESAKDGFAALLNEPGLGIDVSEQALGEFSEEVL